MSVVILTLLEFYATMVESLVQQVLKVLLVLRVQQVLRVLLV